MYFSFSEYGSTITSQIAGKDLDSMNEEQTRQGAKKHFRIQKRWLLPVLAVVVVLGGGIAMRNLRGRQTEGGTAYQSAAVERRDIVTTLTGSGTVQPADSYTVTTLVSGQILSDTFEEGDTVEKDELLYTIDSSDVSSSQSQAQKTYTKAVKSKYPTADLTGTVTEVHVKTGDSVKAGDTLLTIQNGTTAVADFKFSTANSTAFYTGQKAELYLTGFDGTVEGTVTRISGGSAVDSSAGTRLYTVRVEFENPGIVTELTTASAVIAGFSSYGQAALKIGTTSTITAGVSGTVEGMNYLAGDSIRSGEVICTISGDSVDDTIDNALTALENAQDRLDDYEITSPISGTVIEKYAKAGDNAGTGNSGSSPLCIIYDLSYLEMTLSIDELDISKVAVGQSVSITADAVEGRTYEGVVTKVSIVGSTTGGTTTYPVTVRINETEGLLPGMNVDASIELTSEKQVLAIPNGAVNRGNTVLITADSPSASSALKQEAPEGYVYVEIEVGISDDDYIQVLSGLQEGDTVAYLRTSSGNSMMGGMMMGGMPGGGGGMPSGGGMPGGGGGMPGGGGMR